jgi:hypothetical protein
MRCREEIGRLLIMSTGPIKVRSHMGSLVYAWEHICGGYTLSCNQESSGDRYGIRIWGREEVSKTCGIRAGGNLIHCAARATPYFRRPRARDAHFGVNPLGVRLVSLESIA